MHTHRLGLPLRTVFTTTVLEVADQFLFLGIDRDRRLPRGQRLLHLLIDVAELLVAVGMARPLAGLAIGLEAVTLEAVTQIAQKIGDHVATNAMANVTKPGCQITQALGGPQQRRRRIAARRWPDQLLEIAEQRRICRDQRPASAALATGPIRCRLGLCLAAQLRQPATDRAACYPRDPRNRCNSATSRSPRLGGRKTESSALIQQRIERLIPLFDRRIINHHAIL